MKHFSLIALSYIVFIKSVTAPRVLSSKKFGKILCLQSMAAAGRFSCKKALLPSVLHGRNIFVNIELWIPRFISAGDLRKNAVKTSQKRVIEGGKKIPGQSLLEFI